MKHWYLIPLAAVAGLVAGAWGPRADLEALKEKHIERTAKSDSSARSGFGAITQLANIPARASRARMDGDATNRVEIAVGTNEVEVAANTNRFNRAHGSRISWHDREDLRNRIEEAKELWRTRVDLAKTQWKAKLGVSGEKERKFDEMVDAMNADLKDLMSEFAAQIAEKKEVTPEFGVKMMNAVTATLSEEYDALGECVEGDARKEVSKIPIHEFIDPSVFEPMIQVQDYLRESDVKL